ncbi:MAG: tetratricopeptide repeat protein [Candidatus Poribacteria bacterium]
MKSVRSFGQVVSIFCILVFFVGCGSQVQKADKMAMSDPKSAIASYEQIMKTKPGTEEAKLAHLKIADTYYKQLDDQTKGLEVYNEVIKAYPKTKYAGEAEKAIGMHYFQSKEYDQAIEWFKKVTEEVPDTDLAYDATLLMGKSYEESKKYQEAIKIYLDFSKAHPTHRLAAQAALTAAKIYEDKLDMQDEAIEAYKFVASKYSLSSSGREAREALKNMGIDESEIPMGEGQTAQVQQTQNEPQTISQIGTRTRRRATNVPRGDLDRSETRQPAGTSTGPQGTQAAQAAAQARTTSPDFGIDPLSLVPDISVDSQGTMYDALYMIGITYLQSGQYRESGALFEKSLQLVGNKPWNNAASAYLYLGKSYKGIGNNEKAAQMFKEAIKRDSKVIDKMILEGETQYGEEEYDKALESYQTALGLVPYRDWEIYYKMGLVYKKLKNTDKELECFEKSVALKPNDNIDALQNLAEVLYYRKNDPKRATIFDTEAKGQGNNDYKVQQEIADLCYKYNSYSWASTKYGNAIRVVNQKITEELRKFIGTGEEAKQISEDPLKIDLKLVMASAASGNKLAIDAIKRVAPMLDDRRFMIARRALSQIKNKQIADAQKYLESAKEEDPDIEKTAEFHLAIGELLIAQGNKDAGVAEIKKASEIDPQSQEILTRLKEFGQ